MTKPLPHEMIEATRLTQAGRLSEATALLQRLLRGTRSGTNPAEGDAASTAIELSPSVDAGSRRTTRMDIGIATATRAPPGPDAMPHVPSPLRGAFDRLHLGKTAQGLLRALKRSPPAPAEVVPSVGNFVARSFSNEAGSRAYKLYVPSRHEGEPRPLIVMLHGCTQSPDDFAAGTRMNFAAEEHNCFVAYPEQAIAANSSKCWNWFKSGDQQRGRGEPALIAGITRQVMADYDIDPRRIYIAGLSAGGATAAIVGEAYPDLYAAVGVHSGLACGVARDLSSAFAAMQGRHPVPGPRTVEQPGAPIHVPTIVFHGDRDATVHPRNGVEVIARAGAGGEFETVVEHGSVTAGHTYTRSVQSDANGRGLIEEWVIHGADHAWSGGSPTGSFTDPKGPDATKEMLRFFLEHVREPGKPSGK
jgi:poly(hydroxyalkanoate) depolymerase family esterase